MDTSPGSGDAVVTVESIRATMPIRSMNSELDSLSMSPFENTRDSHFYFEAATHRKAVSQLHGMFVDGNQGFGVLSGGPGVGKTLIRTLLHRQLDPLRFVCISVETSLLNFDELMLEIISQMQGDRVYASDLPDRYSRLSKFKSLLSERIAHSGRHLVMMLDEAQGFDHETLDGLRNISNISAERRNLMSIALFGGSRLDQLVHSLPELRQRVGMQLSLQPLDSHETRAYVDHRLRTAGSDRKLALADTVWTRLHRFTDGVPREINRTMKQALEIARAAGSGLDNTCLKEALGSSGSLGAHRPDEFA
jgi:type II secretory pathway predicted ATPase ExeA